MRARTDRFRELRSEDLLEVPGSELDSLLGWLGLDLPRSELRAWVDATRRDRLRTGESEAVPWHQTDEPDEFYRTTDDSPGCDGLSGREERIVEALAHDLMGDYGYAEAPRPPGGSGCGKR